MLDAGGKKTLTDALRFPGPSTSTSPTQNDATVFGSGSHDRTGRHCQGE